MCSCYCLLYFCFFKQKTAYEMRISDWSSDVCSSDLQVADLPAPGIQARKERHRLFSIGLGGHILTVFGDIADEEVRMVEHHKILFTLRLAVPQQLFA